MNFQIVDLLKALKTFQNAGKIRLSVTQIEKLLFEIEKLGGSITSYELMKICGQYQARLKELREKLALQGRTLTQAIPIKGQKRNFSYKLIKPQPEQLQLFN